MTKQKIVIKVAMACKRSQSKAMMLAAATRGVESVAVAGDRLVVVGDNVDSVKLATALRKKIGGADLLEVGEVKKEEEKKKPEAPAAGVEYTTYPFHHYHDSFPPPAAYYHQYPFHQYY